MTKVVVVGSPTIDEQVRQATASTFQVGGVATYGGACFVKERVDSLVVCNLGGEYSSAARKVFSRLGIKFHAGTTAGMTRFRNVLLEEGHRRQELLYVAEPIEGRLIREVVTLPTHIHLGPVHAHDLSDSALEVVGVMASVVSLDVQGYVRSPGIGLVKAAASDSLVAALRVANYVKAERSELEVVLEHLDSTVSGLMDNHDVAEMIVTAGIDGGTVFQKDGPPVDYMASPVAIPFDTTGAGDVFFAAYLVARLYQEMSIVDACDFAAQRAAMQISGEYVSVSDLAL